MTANISIKNQEISKKFLSLSKLYFTKIDRKNFLTNINCIKPERGQYLFPYYREKISLDEFSFVNGDGGKYVLSTPPGDVDKTMENLIPYLTYLRENVTEEEWFKFIKKHIGVFQCHYYSYEHFDYECLIGASDASAKHLESSFKNIVWKNLSRFEREQLIEKLPKIHNLQYPLAKGLVAKFLIDNDIDDERVNNLKYLKSSVFGTSSKIISSDFITLKSSDILNVASWNLSSYIQVENIFDELSKSLIKNFEPLGMIVIRQKMMNNRYSSTELELLIKKVTLEATKLSTQDIGTIIDSIIIKTPNLEDLRNEIVGIIIEEYILEKNIETSKVIESKSLKF